MITWGSCIVKESSVLQPKESVSFLVSTALLLNCFEKKRKLTFCEAWLKIKAVFSCLFSANFVSRKSLRGLVEATIQSPRKRYKRKA
jgi:hypothetical protein